MSTRTDPVVRTLALLMLTLASSALPAQQRPSTGYAPVNGLEMYYEVHGSGDPLVLLHGAFMSIPLNWDGWIDQLARTRRVIAVEVQGHGRTADIARAISSDNLADDVAALLTYLEIRQADVLGYSMGGGVAMRVAVRHPDRVRKVVVISSAYRRDGMGEKGRDAIPKITAEDFKGSPLETEYLRLSPTPDRFPQFVARLVAADSKPGDEMTPEQLRATKAPMFFIHGDADGIRLAHVAEMYRLKGGEVHGDMVPRSPSRLAIVPNATHVSLMQRQDVIIPMVNDFLDAKP